MNYFLSESCQKKEIILRIFRRSSLNVKHSRSFLKTHNNAAMFMTAIYASMRINSMLESVPFHRVQA